MPRTRCGFGPRETPGIDSGHEDAQRQWLNAEAGGQFSGQLAIDLETGGILPDQAEGRGAESDHFSFR